MKFELNRASDGKELGIIEVNSLDELKQLNDKYRNKEDPAWENSQKIVISFDTYYCGRDMDGTITIYDYYIE